MDSIKEFLEGSFTAKKVKVPAHLVLHKLKLSRDDLDLISQEKILMLPAPEEILDLVVGGQIVARGRIVETPGEKFFEITEEV